MAKCFLLEHQGLSHFVYGLFISDSAKPFRDVRRTFCYFDCMRRTNHNLTGLDNKFKHSHTLTPLLSSHYLLLFPLILRLVEAKPPCI